VGGIADLGKHKYLESSTVLNRDSHRRCREHQGEKIPADSIYDSAFPRREELIDSGSKQEQVNNSPTNMNKNSSGPYISDVECPRCWANVCLLSIVVDGRGPSNHVDVGGKHKNIHNFEDNAVFPGGSHGGSAESVSECNLFV